MIYGKEDIRNYFKKVGKKYFAIYYCRKIDGSPIFKSNSAEEIDLEQVYREFDEMIDFLKAGDYTLIMNESEKVSNRGSNRVDFRITIEESKGANAVPQVGSTGPQMDYGQLQEEAKKMAVEQFKTLMNERELVDHKKMLEEERRLRIEAERKVNDPMNKFIAALSPHAEPIVAGLLGKAGLNSIPGVAAVGSVEDGTEQAQQVFESFATTLHKKRPDDYLLIMQKLTKIMQDDPTKFDMAINML